MLNIYPLHQGVMRLLFPLRSRRLSFPLFIMILFLQVNFIPSLERWFIIELEILHRFIKRHLHLSKDSHLIRLIIITLSTMVTLLSALINMELCLIITVIYQEMTVDFVLNKTMLIKGKI